MNETSKVSLSPIIRLANGVVLFIVGLSAFFVIKLILMIPTNIYIAYELTDQSRVLAESTGAVVVVFSIYLSIKFTKKINRSDTRKNRNILRIVTVILGFICMFLTTAFLVISDAMST
jgi:hypothetical protein